MRWAWLLLLAVGMQGQLLPKQFKFQYKHETWQVYAQQGSIVIPGGDCSDGCYGYTDCEAHTMRLDLSQPKHKLQATIKHELFHVITACAGDVDEIIDLPEDKTDAPVHQLIYLLSDKEQEIENESKEFRKALRR